MKNLARMVSLNSSLALDVGYLISVICSSFLEIRGRLHLSTQKERRGCAPALPFCCSKEVKLFALLGCERQGFCPVLCPKVFEGVSYQEYISHYTAAHCAMSVTCPFC